MQVSRNLGLKSRNLATKFGRAARATLAQAKPSAERTPLVDLELKGTVKRSEMDWDPIFLTCCGSQREGPDGARAARKF